MHLYLSSFLLGNRAGDLATLVHTQKAAIVANALDHASSSVRREYAEGQILEFSRLGFEAGELDLRDYFDSRRDLSTVLDAVGLVWVTGGNSFLLRRAMKQSGFDAYITEHRASDRLVYGGFSAGACVAGPTLRGLDIVDAPDAWAEGYVNEVT